MDRTGRLVLVSSLELVACEVTTLGTAGEAVLAGTVEPDSAPALVDVETVRSDSLWGTLRVVWETVGLVSEGWVTTEGVVSGSPEDTLRVGTADLACV